MAEANRGAIDLDKVVAALEKMAETPNANRVTLIDQLSEPRMKEAIKKALNARYTAKEIAGLLAEQGISITPATFAQYWRKIEREDKGEADTKQAAKSSTNKPRTASAPSEAKANAPAKSEGKPLTQKPKMGGAFDSNNL